MLHSLLTNILCLGYCLVGDCLCFYFTVKKKPLIRFVRSVVQCLTILMNLFFCRWKKQEVLKKVYWWEIAETQWMLCEMWLHVVSAILVVLDSLLCYSLILHNQLCCVASLFFQSHPFFFEQDVFICSFLFLFAFQTVPTYQGTWLRIACLKRSLMLWIWRKTPQLFRYVRGVCFIM